MFGNLRRGLIVVLTSILLAACQIIPNGGQPKSTGPVSQPSQSPSASRLPEDHNRHRVALLVPLSGRNAAVGKSLSNAATMALLDTSADNLRITTYDTAKGAGEAAAHAIADGNKLILGPLMRENVAAIRNHARPAHVPIITFSNDVTVARPDVFVMGYIPSQSIDRTVAFAIKQGAKRFAALIPNGEYGQRTLTALRQSVARHGATMVTTEFYDRSNTSIISAAGRLRDRGGFDTVLIADDAKLAEMAAGQLKKAGAALPSIIGPELWSGEASLTHTPAMRGAWFSAVSDARYPQFVKSYRARFGMDPYRISTLGYDAVLLTLRIARDWRPGQPFPTHKLLDPSGFLGLDGPFRFNRNGIGERAFEVREVENGTFKIVSPAPTDF